MKLKLNLGPPRTVADPQKIVQRKRPENVFDYTMLSTFLECNAKYFLRHELHLTTTKHTPAALVLGAGLHAGLATYYTLIKQMLEEGNKIPLEDLLGLCCQAMVAEMQPNIDSGDFPVRLVDAPDGKRCVERAIELMSAYVNFYNYDSFTKVIEIESPFAIIVPYTKETLDGKLEEDEIVYVGRRDASVVYNGELVILEHKTTSIFGQFYMGSFTLNHQVSGYIKSINELLGTNVRRAYINAISILKRKPRVEDFNRFSVERFPAQLRSFETQIKTLTSNILTNRDRLAQITQGDFNKQLTEYEEFFYPNPGACFKWNSQCPYFNICSNFSSSSRATLAKSMFEQVIWSPYDVLTADID